MEELTKVYRRFDFIGRWEGAEAAPLGDEKKGV